MPIIANCIKLDGAEPDENVIAAAAHQLVSGKVGIIPTRCLYGLGTNAFDLKAIRRIFSIKKRPTENPLLVLVEGIEQVEELAVSISPLARRLMARFWPGKVTFLLNARPGMPQGLVGKDNKVGVRLPGHPVTAALVKHAGVPITGTSANVSGCPACSCMDQIDPAVLHQVDLAINAGQLQGGIGSSIIDATLPIPRMLRRGALDEKKFREELTKLQ